MEEGDDVYQTLPSAGKRTIRRINYGEDTPFWKVPTRHPSFLGERHPLKKLLARAAPLVGLTSVDVGGLVLRSKRAPATC